MFIVKRVAHLKQWVAHQKKMNRTIGFVPTMGALHEGHLSLARSSRVQCDLTIVSVFVNPRQFNDPEDLKKYPRPIEEDLSKIYSTNADAVFIPDVEDMYPLLDKAELDFDPGPLGTVMEGQFRPGHFKGVAEVVYRLLKMVEPDQLFLGQKDFQQVAVIRRLISVQQLPVEVVTCPTLREDNGLAMSSRNLRLSEKARKDAGIIYKTLLEIKKAFDQNLSIEQIKTNAIMAIRNQQMDPEYFEIVDGNSLQPVKSHTDSEFIVACTAVKVEGIRLIDNLILKP